MSKKQFFIIDFLSKEDELDFMPCSQLVSDNDEIIEMNYYTHYYIENEIYDTLDEVVEEIEYGFPKTYKRLQDALTTFYNENEKELDDIKKKLKEIFKKENRILANIDRVEEDGMTRLMQFITYYIEDGKIEKLNITRHIAELLDYETTFTDFIVVKGAGMNMAFKVVSDLLLHLFGEKTICPEIDVI